MGLGLLFSGVLKPYAVPFLLVGLLMHAWGMLDKHRAEKTTSDVRLWWAESLYWACWTALLVLLIYVLFGSLR